PLLPQVLNAVGDSFFPMVVSVASAIVLPIAFVIATRWGIEGVAMAWIACYPVILLPMYLRLFSRIELRPMAYLRSLWPALSGSTVMAAVVVAVGMAMPAGTPLAVRLGAKVGLGAVAYVASVLLLHGH